MTELELTQYLSDGVARIVKEMAMASLKDPKTSLMLLQYGKNEKQARKKRAQAEEKGEHVPPFLIASITNRCNLHCKGCYARETKECVDHASQEGVLSAQDWDDIFAQAEQMGVAFILLAGGEPFIRPEVLLEAGNHKSILFPVFTNGTMLNDGALALLEQKRNLLPVLSIEGGVETTDTRRGAGVYRTLQAGMQELKKRGILFGASVTVTRKNMDEVLSAQFVQGLKENGARAIVYVEYVPMSEQDRELAPDDDDRLKIAGLLQGLREHEQEMVMLSFPGDEKAVGGCLAAGRGFFHINARGGAEPCPFSPYSDTNVRDTSLREALRSPLFTGLQQNGNLTEEHVGGCVLFSQREQVQRMLAGETV